MSSEEPNPSPRLPERTLLARSAKTLTWHVERKPLTSTSLKYPMNEMLGYGPKAKLTASSNSSAIPAQAKSSATVVRPAAEISNETLAAPAPAPDAISANAMAQGDPRSKTDEPSGTDHARTANPLPPARVLG